MFIPMFCMFILTFVIGLITAKTRISSVKKGDINPQYFKLMQGEKVPEIITKTTRCFNNLFEVPSLFYAASILYISLGVESIVGVVFAWVFVVLRCIHASVFLTYNHLIHRMVAFWLSFICVLVLWVDLLVHQV